MKYPQLVSNRAVSTISDWLITRLEVLGVEAPIVYSRLLLSLLHTPLQVDSVDLADIPQLKNCLGKRFNSRRLTRSDAERLKRGAAIESLMEVVEDNEKRSRIVDLVSELCSKLRELEDKEQEEKEEYHRQEELESQKAEAMASKRQQAGGLASGARHKENGGSGGGSGAKLANGDKRAGNGIKSNPYYQMFPALSSGNNALPTSSGSSSRATSMSGGSGNENWGQQLQPNGKWRRDELSEGDAAANGGSGGGQYCGVATGPGASAAGSNKRKNKKRRTNGPSANVAADKKVVNGGATSPKPMMTNVSTVVAAANTANHHHLQNQLSFGSNRKKSSNSKCVEWDTNFSGQWEMEEKDPIKEFLNAQRGGAHGQQQQQNHHQQSDCESVTSGSVLTTTTDDAGYDNVFKMKRSDVNQEQTMLIKSFLTQSVATANKNAQFMMAPPAPGPQPNALGFGFESAEEFLNLSTSEHNEAEDGHRRLFEREVSAESFGVTSSVGMEEVNTEFDAKLESFKAKFNTNIRNLWSQEEQGGMQDEAMMESGEFDHQRQQPHQPLSLNSFWQNYNKHLYDVQDNNNCHSLEQTQNFNSWPMTEAEKPVNTMAIWSNSEEYENPAATQLCLQQYNEHMAAAYMKQLAFSGPEGGNNGGAGGQWNGQLTAGEPMDLFATAGAGIWSTEGCSSLNSSGGGGGNGGDLEHLYYSAGLADYNMLAGPESMMMGGVGGGGCVDSNNNNSNGQNVVEVENLKLEQSIAMINHSTTSSFAKVDRKGYVGFGSSGRYSGSGSGGSSSLSGMSRNGNGGGASSITNMSSLYGSFKQNSMENLLTSERTHFRPIKQAYLDGHTFDIPCSPDTIEYVRSKSGSMFFELDKYMEYHVEEPNQDNYDLQLKTTNVPISRCGTIVTESDLDEPMATDKDWEVKESAVEKFPVVKRSAEGQRMDPQEERRRQPLKKKFTLKFCVRTQNEKCCQTEVIDYEQLYSNNNKSGSGSCSNSSNSSNKLLLASSSMGGAMLDQRKYPNNLLPNVSTLDDADLEAVAYELLADDTNDQKWPNGGAMTLQNMSLLWENSDSNSLDSCLNYESLPANRLLRDELSADAEEILKDSLTYMQNLYIDDEEEDGEEMVSGGVVGAGDTVNDLDLANYYEMGQLISEILNPGAATAKKIAQVFGEQQQQHQQPLHKRQKEMQERKEDDLLWYKNWSQNKNWLPILDQSAVMASLCKVKNVWNYNNNHNNIAEVVVDSNGTWREGGCGHNNTDHVDGNVDGNNNQAVEEEDSSGDWKFSNLRRLWNDAQLILNEEEGNDSAMKERDEQEEEEEEELDDLLEDCEKNYHLIVFEKKNEAEPVTVNGERNGGGIVMKGRKRRHSASQNLFDEDLEMFNGGDVKWYDYCCKCDCGKRSEKILKYRNKLLMKRVDKMDYASLLLKNFSKQFDSIDEILNEGLIAMPGEICEYEGSEYCGGGGGGALVEKICMDQVSMLKNPNLYLNRTTLISMARPLTR